MSARMGSRVRVCALVIRKLFISPDSNEFLRSATSWKGKKQEGMVSVDKC